MYTLSGDDLSVTAETPEAAVKALAKAKRDVRLATDKTEADRVQALLYAAESAYTVLARKAEGKPMPRGWRVLQPSDSHLLVRDDERHYTVLHCQDDRKAWGSYRNYPIGIMWDGAGSHRLVFTGWFSSAINASQSACAAIKSPINLYLGSQPPNSTNYEHHRHRPGPDRLQAA